MSHDYVGRLVKLWVFTRLPLPPSQDTGSGGGRRGQPGLTQAALDLWRGVLSWYEIASVNLSSASRVQGGTGS